MAKNLPAPENFRRHWEVQKRHSGALAPLLETLCHFLSCHIPLRRNDKKDPKNAIPAQSIGKE